MDFKTRWDYKHAVDRAVRDTNYDARNYLTLVVLIGFPLGLIINREMPGMLLGTFLLPLPVIYYLTFYKWHTENRRTMQGFGPSVKVSVGNGMLGITDGKTCANLELANILELAAFIPEKDGVSGYRLIVGIKGMEYVLPGDAEGIEDLFREFRDDQVFDTQPIDRPDIRPGRWIIWKKEGAA